MAITALTDPGSLPDQSQDQDTFDANMAAMIRNLPLRAQQENELAANLNAIAFGGAYAIPYKFVANVSLAGDLSLDNPAAQSSTAAVRVSTTSLGGASVASTISSFGASTSIVKGHIQITKVADSSKWLRFAVTSVTLNTGYYALGVLLVDASSANPFSVNDTVVLSFTRTGDKGDTSAATPVLWVRDIRAAGTAGDNAAAGGYVVRALNDTRKNTIPGATISSNRVTLPAGTYRGGATAVAYAVNAHQCYFYNITNGAFAGEGSSARAGTGVMSESEIAFMEFTITATTVFELRHWTNSNTTGGLGPPVSNNVGMSEVYAQLYLEKIA